MKKITLWLLAIAFLSACQQAKDTSNTFVSQTAVDAQGYEYEFIENDPLNLRIYTLENGLKVYLSNNEIEPRAVGMISVNAGAKDDPRDNTGLAHYLEHLMFKGTFKIGSVNWEEESKYLQQIEDLFEKRKFEKDSTKREMYYHQIDSISQIAAEYAAPNEYDKLMSVIGAKNTNAGTGVDMTSYINDIPSNEIERWLEIESERFGDLVLRLFHTELETVYEEYNMYQSESWSVVNHALAEEFYKVHPYGIDIIGTSEHLKNPSMKNIKEFFNTYYVPNNMAIIISGELDYDKTIKAVDQYWGKFKPSEKIERAKYEKEAPIVGPIEKEVFTQDAAYVEVAYRTEGSGSKEENYYELIDYILSNSKAGLIDLNLVQNQKILRAYSYHSTSDDYGKFVLHANPREGQTLEEAKDLLLAQLDKIKKGEFDEWLLEAIIDNQRVNRIRGWERNWRAYTLAYNFHGKKSHADYLNHFNELAKITKKDLVDFANKHLKDNYVVVYKRQGENKDLVRMEKPSITPIDIDRSKESEFYKEVKDQDVKDIEPVFVDFQEKIKVSKLNEGIELDYIQNKTNDLFSLYFVINAGSSSDQKLKTAVEYLPYVGTSTMSADSLKKLMFKLAINIGVGTSADQSYVYFNGLDKNFKEGLKLFKQILTDAKGDKASYDNFTDGILKKRMDNKQNKDFIFWNGLFSYAIYGADNALNTALTAEELKAIDSETIMNKVHVLNEMPKNILYYGPKEEKALVSELDALGLIPSELKTLPENKLFEEVNPEENTVLFVDYDMVQSNVAFLSIDGKYNPELEIPSTMFNEYYGGSMSSIVFQEIRESKGLAYTAFSNYSTPSDPKKSNITYSYIGTQPDKIELASETMLDLLNNMPKAENNFIDVKNALQKRMRTERYKFSDIFWAYLDAKKMGKTNDGKKELYESIPNYTLEDVQAFFDAHVKGKTYTMIVIGSKAHVDFDTLKKFGKVKEVTVEELFHHY